MQFASEPQQWRIELKNGSTMGIWAMSYGETDGHYHFKILVDASEQEQADDELVIVGRTPTNPERILITTARIPVSAVKEIHSDSWDPVSIS